MVEHSNADRLLKERDEALAKVSDREEAARELYRFNVALTGEGTLVIGSAEAKVRWPWLDNPPAGD